MMHIDVARIAGIWITLLLVIMVVYAVWSKSSAERIVAVDAMALILVALLILFSVETMQPYYLDAALALALISFIGPIAAARRRAGERIL